MLLFFEVLFYNFEVPLVVLNIISKTKKPQVLKGLWQYFYELDFIVGIINYSCLSFTFLIIVKSLYTSSISHKNV